MENYDGATPWLKKQARWSIPDLTRALHMHCKYCNGTEVFTEVTDCVSIGCPLFPFRPGSARPEVAGVKRAARKAQTGGRMFTATREDGASKPQFRGITLPGICGAGVGAKNAPGAPNRTKR